VEVRAVLDVRQVTKRFGALTAVDGVSLRAGAGETVGLLGPNGAGKTTIVSMIAGLVRPDAGEVLVEGRPLGGDTDPLKRHIGLVTQDIALVDELSAANNLEFFAALYALDRRTARRAIAEHLSLVGLTERARDTVGTFSGGMKRRLNLAAALLHDPQVLLLDEPTVGVDPQSRNAIFDNLETLKRRGKTLLYTTHYMEEAERLCDRVVIVDRGRVIADDTVEGLARRVPSGSQVVIELEQRDAVVPDAPVRALGGVERVDSSPGTLRIAVSDLSSALPAVLGWCAGHGFRYRHVTTERASLETVFLTLTGRSLRD
jgi:ABC-2 type transport system ATP-binding protein